MMRVGVVGAGLIGRRRAQIAAESVECQLCWVADTNPDNANSLAQHLEVPALAEIDLESIDCLVVATPNGHLLELASQGLRAGKHVLVEKPPGRNLAEAKQLIDLSQACVGQVLKVGFNHRYHPGLQKLHSDFQSGAIGKALNIRARYGHGGRPGYENEWRGNPALAGGGVLLDQGVHLADLCNWILGCPATAYGINETLIWPIAPLEDSAFGLLHYPAGQTASLHVTWTQWKNLFSFELFGELGSLAVEGLGGSYGVQKLTSIVRRLEGGIPQVEEHSYPGSDPTWKLEWEDFLQAIKAGKSYWGTPSDGLTAMRIIDALYRSSSSGQSQSV